MTADLGVKIPRDIVAEAAQIGTRGSEAVRRAELAERVKNMDPPTRAAAAMVLAVEGCPYPEIANVLDYSTAKLAKEAVWAAIADAGADHDDVARMRSLQSARLDKLLYSVMRRATANSDPDQLSYARVALAILDRQARLFGIDAAQHVVLYTPTQREIAQYAQQVTSLMRTQAGAVEADIIVEAEIEDDDA